MKIKNVGSLLILLLFFQFSVLASDRDNHLKRIKQTDVEYLNTLLSDTWRCLDALWEPQTGLPYDNIYRGEYTSVTNIGLSFAVTAGAYEMGYLKHEDALNRLTLALESLQKIKRWHGFCQSWNSVKMLKPSPNDYWISTLDTGNMIGGLLIARSTFPELREEIDQYLGEMDWSWICAREAQTVYGGYITDQEKFVGPLTWVGGDPRLACFLAIVYGGVDIGSWDHLNREEEEKYGQKYLLPGCLGGGLFMQYISGLFMFEWASPLNRSAANFAFAQILYAKEKKYPVWGWSASDSPHDGYLGWGRLLDQVVTPHASILALDHYPGLVLKNLIKLEEMGARKPWKVDSQEFAYGFRDAIDMNTHDVTQNYLYLDQGMIFLTIVNFLKEDVLRKAVEKNAEIAKVKMNIKDYHAFDEDQFIETLKARDASPGKAQTIKLWKE